MEIVRDNSILKAIAKRYHLEFCLKFKYYEGDAYKNAIGEDLPHYFGYKGRVYILKYIDGCFNPFLVDRTLWVKKEIEQAYDRKEKQETQEWKDKIQHYIDGLENLFKVK